MPTDFFGGVVTVFQEYGVSMLEGAVASLRIAMVGTIVGCLIGFAVGLVQTIPVTDKDNPVKRAVLWAVKLVLNVYVEFFRGTPMMAQAMFIYYGLLPLLGLRLTIWQAAYFILSINTGAYMAETVRGGILSIDPGQTEGAMAIGMNHFQTMTSVILPQALRNIMPQIGNNLIINIKDTCVLTIIGVTELTYATRSAAGAYYTFFEAYTIAMVFYFILTFICSRILRVIEKRMDGPENFALAMDDAIVLGEGTYKYHGNPVETNHDVREFKRDEALRKQSGNGGER